MEFLEFWVGLSNGSYKARFFCVLCVFAKLQNVIEEYQSKGQQIEGLQDSCYCQSWFSLMKVLVWEEYSTRPKHNWSFDHPSCWRLIWTRNIFFQNSWILGLGIEGVWARVVLQPLAARGSPDLAAAGWSLNYSFLVALYFMQWLNRTK